MKKTILSIAFVSALFAPVQLQAQEESSELSKMNFERSIQLRGDSKTDEITIPIEAGTRTFSIEIKSEIRSGNLVVEVYDSKGKKQGNFSIGTQVTGDKTETVSGNLYKEQRTPLPGNWKVKISPNDAVGRIHIRTQYN